MVTFWGLYWSPHKMCGFGDEWFSVDDSDLNIKGIPLSQKVLY
jgi:hypothetical protein